MVLDFCASVRKIARTFSFQEWVVPLGRKWTFTALSFGGILILHDAGIVSKKEFKLPLTQLVVVAFLSNCLVLL